MPYHYQNSKGQTYSLHGKEVTLQNGRKQSIFYFAGEAKPGEALDALPAGKAVIENPRTGLPFLKGAAPGNARSQGRVRRSAGLDEAVAPSEPAAVRSGYSRTRARREPYRLQTMSGPRVSGSDRAGRSSPRASRLDH